MDIFYRNYAYHAYMDLLLLRSFLAVAETGTITGAADRLNITQPALSRRIVQLEEHFGVALLARGRKGVTLTALGKYVAPQARLIVERYERLLGEVSERAELRGGTVRVGGGATAVSCVLPDAIAAYQPHRKRPRALDGLKKNVRLDENGRHVLIMLPGNLNREITLRSDTMSWSMQLPSSLRHRCSMIRSDTQ